MITMRALAGPPGRNLSLAKSTPNRRTTGMRTTSITTTPRREPGGCSAVAAPYAVAAPGGPGCPCWNCSRGAPRGGSRERKPRRRAFSARCDPRTARACSAAARPTRSVRGRSSRASWTRAQPRLPAPAGSSTYACSAGQSTRRPPMLRPFDLRRNRKNTRRVDSIGRRSEAPPLSTASVLMPLHPSPRPAREHRRGRPARAHGPLPARTRRGRTS